MNIQVLPNWCKKLGLLIFILSFVISGTDSFLEGFYSYGKQDPVGVKIFEPYVSEGTKHVLELVTIVGMLIYMLSKEKIEDDYIKILRLESFQLTMIIGLLSAILLYSFSEDIKLTLDYFIYLFMWFYLITFFIKKRID